MSDPIKYNDPFGDPNKQGAVGPNAGQGWPADQPNPWATPVGSTTKDPSKAADLNQQWMAYQAGRKTPNNVRDTFQMDQDIWGKYDQSGMDGMDNGPKYRMMAEGLEKEGFINSNDRDAAIARLEQTGGRWLYDADNRMWDPNTSTDSYRNEDPAHRAALTRASDLGHALPDSTELSQAGYQNVDQAMRERLRDEGFGSYGASGGTGSFKPSGKVGGGLSGMAGIGGAIGGSISSSSSSSGPAAGDRNNVLYDMLRSPEFERVIVFGRTKHGINKLEEVLVVKTPMAQVGKGKDHS